MALRRIGHDEASVIQTLLAIVDAQSDYAAQDPMNTGAPSYARRPAEFAGQEGRALLGDQAGRAAEFRWGPAIAKAQADGKSPDGHYGYYFRLLYGQGTAAPGRARDYVVNGRMIGGFGVIAWPVRYGDTGVMTFIVNQDGIVYQQDLGPKTAERAGERLRSSIRTRAGVKADMTPP